MKKICHMTSAHAPGDTRIFYKECVSLSKAGYEVYLVQRGKSQEQDGVHIVGVGQPTGGRLLRMSAFSQKVYKAALMLNADVYHFHDPELLPYGLKNKKKGKKVIFDSHEFTLETILEKKWLPKGIRKAVHCCYGLYERYICNKLDAVISVTPHIVEYFKTINAKATQISNYPIFEEQARTPDFSEKRVGFAGGISAQWMHENILKALQQLPECRYTLCGPGGEGYLSCLQALPGWKQTDYLGKIPHYDVAMQLSRCSVGIALLRPSRNTDWKNGTMGNTKIFEEMMAGLPVVCTNFVCWKEFVKRYQCGICVDPENVEEITSAIRYLLNHPQEARQMGGNGRRAVREEFNWAVEERKLLALYEEIIKE